MKKLLRLTKEQLNNEYFIEFGIFTTENDKNLLIAALFYGKRIDYLTQEEIQYIQEL